jgi:hypothetical protein
MSAAGAARREVNAEQNGPDVRLRRTAWHAVIIIDPDALGRCCRTEQVAGWEPVELAPLRLGCQPVAETTDLGRVAHVSDETDLTSTDEGAGDTEAADQAAAVEAAMAEARVRLASVPAEVVVTNHVMGLYELGALHLSSDTPDLAAASLAIDSMAMLVEGLGDRLGDDAPAMTDALANIRMAFVSVKAQSSSESSHADDT